MLAQTKEQFDKAVKHLKQAKFIAVDTETTGFDWYKDDQIIGISMTTAYEVGAESVDKFLVSWYFPFRHECDQFSLFNQSDNLPLPYLDVLRQLLTRRDCTYIYHNFKFDAKMLLRDGIDVHEDLAVWDTMVMSHMINENGTHSLKGLAEKYFGKQERDQEAEIKKLVKKLGGYHKVSPADMGEYACKDTELTLRLFLELLNEFNEQEFMPLWNHTLRFQHCLKTLEWEGIELDVEFAQSQAQQAQARLAELKQELGFDPLKLDDLARTLFAKPPIGLGLYYDPDETSNTTSEDFPLGRPTMDEAVLSKLNHPLADKVLEVRGLVKAISTWWEGYQEKMGPDQRIHPTYATSSGKEKYGTVTGRLSSSNPNIQQMPRDPATPVKNMLQPPTGASMFEFDYAQVELRLASAYAKDPVYLEAFYAGVDAHQSTADMMKVDRQTAKHAAFCILYGGGAGTLKNTIEKLEYAETGQIIDYPLSDAKDILETYYKVHPVLRQYALRVTQTIQQNGFIKLWNGRRRHFNETETYFSSWKGHHVTENGYPLAHKGFNSLIQGGAAGIMEQTMLNCYDRYKSGDVNWRMVLQVHDSIWFEIPYETEEDDLAQIKELMEWPSEPFGVPFPVDYKKIRTHEICSV